YGFDTDNRIGLTEDWPTRQAAHLPYAREKAEVEQILAAERAGHPELRVYVLRPSIVLGPHTMRAKTLVPARLAGRATRLGVGAARPVVTPRVRGRCGPDSETDRRTPAPAPPGTADVAGGGRLAHLARHG